MIPTAFWMENSVDHDQLADLDLDDFHMSLYLSSLQF